MKRTSISARRAYPVAREGWIFIFIFLFVAIFFVVVDLWFIAWPMFFLTAFTIFFFRNPVRISPAGEDLIISPADGKVLEVKEVEENRYTHSRAKKVSIFMSVFNVHVNRVPFSGNVENISYHPGKFFVASLDKASESNERNAIILNSPEKGKVAVVQIAGVVARRIVCYLKEGLNVVSGERLGIIRFGSRVELYLPVSSEIDVQAGEKVFAGKTVIGRFK